MVVSDRMHLVLMHKTFYQTELCKFLLVICLKTFYSSTRCDSA